ncbi:hypothetical protein [Nonomuraea sp. NEAU-A123]|uniref:tetratricopeptide repeat protein n=1 Tax=Nonomuraea sp. NEAU-A123 TaxID=2839649 RepID=UPI001BE47B34|nr:hypothetical protein [Nonomuraea sp. NEAU-A123]MBT2231671.1 hypothetical protein [Nonomuraea sp. NEAU-A123]
MATFVLNPPPGVRVVSFFITARYAGQSDRNAFLDVVIEQLAELLGQPMPGLLTEATQRGWFGRLLKEATRLCKQRGERLVLVVDGLDEDRGVTVGPGAHSIAALLPAAPSEGLRIVVAGRPNPPVPSDVPARHPLRNPTIMRLLSSSPSAQIIRDDAERELDHLLYGSQTERDLLGVLVTAGGGLSSGDLAELTGLAASEVDRQLRAVSGRTFSSRDSRWRPQEGAEIFVLAHEELQATAIAAFGETALAVYLDTIHVWADRYRDQGWPSGTPEFLLRGYHQLLLTTGNIARMVAYAIDRARLDRMLDVSGGDASALSEILTCQGVVCKQEMPDLQAMLLLARTREFLADRNANIPIQLPAVWVKLGNPMRAEALARSISNAKSQAKALTTLARALADAGQHDHAAQVAQQAEAQATLIKEPKSQAQVLSDLIVPFSKVGWLVHADQLAERAEIIARSITGSFSQIQALGGLVNALARAGQFDRAKALAYTMADSDPPSRVLHDLIGVLAGAGEFDRAEAVADSIANEPSQAQALRTIAHSLARAGKFDSAETLARSIADFGSQSGALRDIASALARNGQLERAETLADAINDHTHQFQALRILANALGAAGYPDRVIDVARRAANIARFISEPDRARGLRDISGILGDAGHFDAAEACARAIERSELQAQALHGLVRILASAREFDRAEVLAQSIIDPIRQACALCSVAVSLAEAGQFVRASQVAQNVEMHATSIIDQDSRDKALRDLVDAYASTHQFDRAEALAKSINDPDHRAASLRRLGSSLKKLGDLDYATHVLHELQKIPESIASVVSRAERLTTQAGALARASKLNEAREVALLAEKVARSITNPAQQLQGLHHLVGALAESGQVDQAHKLACSIDNADLQAQALTSLAITLSQTGQIDQIEKVARQAEQVAGSVSDANVKASLLRDLASVLAQAGQTVRAEALIQSISNPHIQAEAITAIVAQMDTQKRRQLLTRALTKLRSDTLLIGIARVEPSIVAQLAEDMELSIIPQEE